MKDKLVELSQKLQELVDKYNAGLKELQAIKEEALRVDGAIRELKKIIDAEESK